MTKPRKTEEIHIAEARARLLDAALPHVVFDGWTRATLEAAIADSGVDAGLARLLSMPLRRLGLRHTQLAKKCRRTMFR